MCLWLASLYFNSKELKIPCVSVSDVLVSRRIFTSVSRRRILLSFLSVSPVVLSPNERMFVHEKEMLDIVLLLFVNGFI